MEVYFGAGLDAVLIVWSICTVTDSLVVSHLSTTCDFVSLLQCVMQTDNC